MANRSHMFRLRNEIVLLTVAIALAYYFHISQTNIEVIVFKFLIFTSGVIAVHLSRSALFPYIDLGANIRGDGECADRPIPIRVAVIASVFAYYCVLIFAITQAL